MAKVYVIRKEYLGDPEFFNPHVQEYDLDKETEKSLMVKQRGETIRLGKDWHFWSTTRDGMRQIIQIKREELLLRMDRKREAVAKLQARLTQIPPEVEPVSKGKIKF